MMKNEIIDDKEVYRLMELNPNSLISHAYRLGLRDANNELSKPINELLQTIKRLENENRGHDDAV